MSTAQKIWSKRSKKVSFLPVDEYGRYSVPVLTKTFKRMKGRGQSPSTVISLAFATFFSKVPNIPIGMVRDISHIQDPYDFTRVRVVCERFLVESACWNLLSRNDSNNDYKPCWTEFSQLVENVSFMIKTGTVVAELAAYEKVGDLAEIDKRTNTFKVPKVQEEDVLNPELRAAKLAAKRELRRMRNAELKAMLKAANAANGIVTTGNVVTAGEHEVFDPELELWTIKET